MKHHIKHHVVKHKKKMIWIIEGSILAAAAIFAFGYAFVKLSGGEIIDRDMNVGSKVVKLTCDNDYEISPTYYLPDEHEDTSKLSLSVSYASTTNVYAMVQAISGSGSKYDTPDGRLSFWEHQGIFSYIINGVTVSDCEVVIDKTHAIKNGTYAIDGQSFTLIDGKAEVEVVPGSATKNTLEVFGEPVYGDLDNDGDDDAAVLLVNNPGGSGLFYYAVIAIQGDAGIFTSTNALLLGDRISPQTVEIHEGNAAYNYAERKASEPLSTPPSVGKTLWVHYDPKVKAIGQLEKDFTGEADPSIMTLSMQKWSWIKTESESGVITTPKKEGVFSITFDTNDHVHITTDCNSINGTYILDGKYIQFEDMTSTKMACEGSQEWAFSVALNKVVEYAFTGKGELQLKFATPKGMIVFR